MFTVLVLGFVASAVAIEGAECKNVTTQPNFNLTKYAAHKWYIHKEQPISYLPKDESYCVVATCT